jgi:hypothetical protein
MDAQQRVGNYQFDPCLSVLIDQLWVRQAFEAATVPPDRLEHAAERVGLLADAGSG